jgi:hypothetical protein
MPIYSDADRYGGDAANKQAMGGMRMHCGVIC